MRHLWLLHPTRPARPQRWGGEPIPLLGQGLGEGATPVTSLGKEGFYFLPHPVVAGGPFIKTSSSPLLRVMCSSQNSHRMQSFVYHTWAACFICTHTHLTWLASYCNEFEILAFFFFFFFQFTLYVRTSRSSFKHAMKCYAPRLMAT